MTDFWANVHQAVRGRRARPPAEPSVTVPDEVDYTMDQYAEQRNVPKVNSLGRVEENTSGFMNAEDLRGIAPEVRRAMDPYRVHETNGNDTRQRGIPADSIPASLGGIRARGAIDSTTR